MALQFTRAQTPAKGDAITSRQMISLARACNDRTRSGIGDAAWRQAQLWFNLFRLPRNPDADGLTFPSQAEFFEVFQHVMPETGLQWPLAGPGEPQGANVANMMMQFVFGLAPYLSGEAARLSEGVDESGIPTGMPLWLGTGPATTPAEIWELGKRQRGAIDPETFAQFVPALETAQKFFEISAPLSSPHGKSYGGFFPTPVELAPNCGATEDTGLLAASYEYFWTALREGVATAGYHGTPSTVDGKARITYAGSCPLGSDDTAAGHVVYLLPLPFAWYVAVNDGAGGFVWDRFDRADWIIGPFEGNGVLSREDSGMLHRAIWQFAADFRGSRDQRKEDDFEIEKIAFEFQAFSEEQYHLAPNIARFSGGVLEPLYPFFQLIASGTVPAGAAFSTLSGLAHQYTAGFVLSALKVRTKGLTGGAVVELLDAGKVFFRASVTGAGSGETHQIFTVAARTPNLSVRLADVAQLSGRIEVECNELLEYKGHWWDFYLLLRLSATGGGGSTTGGVDGSGLDYEFSREIWDAYQANGCIVNAGTPGPRDQADWVNDNPVFEAARRLSRNHVRVLSRRQFRSYAVTGGKSVLRLYRHARGAMGVAEDLLDCLEDIAPSKNPMEPGALVQGEEYIVRGTTGQVTYRGAMFGPDQRFICDRAAFFSATGDCQVHIYNGIRPVAFPKGWTNEWVMFLEGKVANHDEASIWKPSAYADFYAFHNRCLYRNFDAANPSFRRHVTYNHQVIVTSSEDGSRFINQLLPARAAADFFVVESPSGYNYALGANRTFSDEPFFSSCQIYKAPYEIESAVIEFEDGVEIAKLTFKERFQTHGDAPASVDPNPGTWDGTTIANLEAEDYRTDDNCLREYALHLASPIFKPTVKIGDRSAGASVVDDVTGSVFPHFFFVRLIPEPYEDNNERLDNTDTRCTVDAMLHAEIAIRAMCEGFVDDRTSLAITCQTGQGSLYDYSFANLCFDAFSGTSIGAFSLAARPDNPSGFGPLPNTWMYAEVFTRLASAVNLLTRARVMLPFSIECQTWSFARSKEITPEWPAPPPTCSEGAGQYAVVWQGCPDPPDIRVCDDPCDPPPWDDCGLTVSAASSAYINPEQCPGTAGNFLLTSSRTVVNYRVALSDGYELAIPAAWRDQIASIGGFVGLWTETAHRARCATTEDIGEAQGCCEAYQTTGCAHEFWDGDAGQGWTDCWEPDIIESVEECRMINSGQIDPRTPPCGSPFVGSHDNQDIEGQPGARCYNTAGREIFVEVMTDPGFFVLIPLVDL